MRRRRSATGSTGPPSWRSSSSRAVRRAPDPRHPPGVPSEAFEPPALATPDDPRQPLARLPGPHRDGRSGVAARRSSPRPRRPRLRRPQRRVVDHPGNAARIELGHRPERGESRSFGAMSVTYAPVPTATSPSSCRPPTSRRPLQPALEPTIAIEATAPRSSATRQCMATWCSTAPRCSFPRRSRKVSRPTPAATRRCTASSPRGRRAALDVGSLNGGDRTLVLGVDQGRRSSTPRSKCSFPESSGTPRPLVRILGNVRIEGTLTCDDVRTRTVTEEVAALLTGMVQAGIAAG